MQRLGATQDRREALHRDPHQVHLGLLCSELNSGGLCVEPQHPRLRVLGPESLLHDARPHPPCGPELCHFLDDRRARDEEEGQARSEIVDVLAGLHGRSHVLDPVGQREGDLLHGSSSRLGHVITGDGDRVPFRNLGSAVREDVGNQSQALRRRVDISTASDVLLQNIVLDRSADVG